MMTEDMLLMLAPYPEPLSREELGAALDAAGVLGGHLTALVCEPRVRVALTYHPYPQALIDLQEAEQTKAHDAALKQLETVEAEAQRRGLAYESRLIKLTTGVDAATEFARLRNVTILPYAGDDQLRHDIRQSVIFESGRPMLLLPPGGAPDFKLDEIVVAWDFSRAASRAVQDAMPLLRQAKQVRVVSVKSDKSFGGDPSGTEFAKHLSRNGVNAALEEIELGDRSIGEAISDAAKGADLLVMGAFGHSRLRDFFLGGATRHILANPALPVFLSH